MFNVKYGTKIVSAFQKASITQKLVTILSMQPTHIVKDLKI